MSIRALGVVHLLANAALLAGGYAWLGVEETRGVTLAWSFLLALFLAAAFVWHYGALVNRFASDAGFRSWPGTLSRIPPLLIAALLTAALYWLLALWHGTFPSAAATTASFITLKLQRPVAPGTILRVFNALLWMLRWLGLPLLLAPMFAAIALRGWKGFSCFGRIRRGWRRFLLIPLVIAASIWLPGKLLGWAPLANNFGLELFSFLLRAAVALVVFSAGGLAAAFLAARGRQISE